MEVLTSNYIIPKLVSSREEQVPLQGCCLWVWYADRIPPHIGISLDDKYYSLKANGKDEKLPIETVIAAIHAKKITTLCIALTDELDITTLESTFARYTQTIPNEITCLQPIKNLLDVSEAEKLTHVLDTLYAANRITHTIGFYTDSFSGIQDYSTQDIHARLQVLSNG